MGDKRKYNPELKAEAIRMMYEQGMTHAEVGRKLGIPKGTIGNLVSGYSEASPAAPPEEQIYAAIKADNARLRKELT